MKSEQTKTNNKIELIIYELTNMQEKIYYSLLKNDIPKAIKVNKKIEEITEILRQDLKWK